MEKDKENQKFSGFIEPDLEDFLQVSSAPKNVNADTFSPSPKPVRKSPKVRKPKKNLDKERENRLLQKHYDIFRHQERWAELISNKICTICAERSAALPYIWCAECSASYY